MKNLNEVAIELIESASTNCMNDSEAIVNVITPWGKILQIQVSIIDSEESDFNDYSGIKTESFESIKSAYKTP